ncbi:hypothetical protein B0I35DRAFT_349917 [Stachybotrys elegans]|uniref:FAD-binding PCMH-type domain-containing protein n=1 Tax=Stachybotrys elegans TaxID=80388 RepID=A0A8K0WSN6_9HYPO|nr:hypothetical protein B0I35DRAFT_349917 [Stachybotrys elegans]
MKLSQSPCALGGLALSAGSVLASNPASCKSLPGDPGWPSLEAWSSLNETVSGALIATVPQAHVCHLQPYRALNETVCNELQENWNFAQTFRSVPNLIHLACSDRAPAEIMNAYFQNQSCDPFTPVERPCELGNYAVYSISVSGPEDVIAGINFAKDNNVRLVVKNTGHDYAGKSTGKGSLSFWTHNLKSIEVVEEYSAPYYSGPAAIIGAGVTAGELLEHITPMGYRAVGGTCASVGTAGGYAAGGGHSILNGVHGMGADNVLEWEMVTPSGEHIIVRPDNDYKDLYWAMTGGGAGVWGVVLSMTYKIHPDGRVGGARLSFNDSLVEPDLYWRAVEAWHSWIPAFTDGLDGGNTAEYTVSAHAFSAISLTFPGQNVEAVDELMRTFLGQLEDLGIAYDYTSRSLPTFYDHFDADLGPLPYGPWPTNTVASGRLISRSTVQDEESNAALIAMFRNMTEYQDGKFFMGCEAMHVKETEHPKNAVLPAWREVASFCIVHGYWDWEVPREEMLEHKNHLVDVIIPAYEAVTTESGAYLNEIDPLYKGDWKKELYGENYDQLLGIKTAYDPDHLFYALFGVASDEWFQDGEGRLCRA